MIHFKLLQYIISQNIIVQTGFIANYIQMYDQLSHFQMLRLCFRADKRLYYYYF